jgi:hypothetical protein
MRPSTRNIFVFAQPSVLSFFTNLDIAGNERKL